MPVRFVAENFPVLLPRSETENGKSRSAPTSSPSMEYKPVPQPQPDLEPLRERQARVYVGTYGVHEDDEDLSRNSDEELQLLEGLGVFSHPQQDHSGVQEERTSSGFAAGNIIAYSTLRQRRSGSPSLRRSEKLPESPSQELFSGVTEGGEKRQTNKEKQSRQRRKSPQSLTDNIIIEDYL